MSGGRQRRRGFLGEALSPCGHKGVLLMADERKEALRLRSLRFGPVEIARALGRSVPSVKDFLDSVENPT